MRVKVWNGDGSQFLGTGTVVGYARVHVFVSRDYQSLLTPDNPEERPSDEVIAEMDRAGCFLEVTPNNPKIVMDDGAIRYGSMVWFEALDEVQDPVEVFKSGHES